MSATETQVQVDHPVVSREEWIVARKALLVKEKEATRQRDEMARQRRELPWVSVDKQYMFEGPDGRESLADLFGERSQLLVYHFMLGPGWAEGCKSCSYLADHFEGPSIHLPHRDVAFVVVSRAPYAEIAAFQKRMGWKFKWVSSYDSDFNFDYHVSATPDEKAHGEVYYNYRTENFPSDEMPGLSAFFKDKACRVYHTYSTYARGLDALVGTYTFLDLAPKGRDEGGLPFTMEWVRHHDKYTSTAAAPSCCCKT